MENLTSIHEHSDYLENNFSDKITKWELHRLRIDFGQRDLEVWQFLPSKRVKGKWKVLSIPHSIKMGYDEWDENGKIYDDVLEYQKAKHRCLFDGFQIEEHEFNSFSIRSEDNILNVMWKYPEEDWKPAQGIVKIEDIAKYNPKLSQTSKTELGNYGKHQKNKTTKS